MTFMQLMPEMEDILGKKKELLSRAGSKIADALHNRISNHGIDKGGAGTERDIRNAIGAFDIHDQNEILIKALIALSIKMNSSPSADYGSKKKGKRDAFDW